MSSASASSHGPFRRATRQFVRDKVAVLAAGWILAVAAVAVLSLVWTPHDPNLQFVFGPFAGFSRQNPLSTDDLGRDILSRMMVGSWVSLRVSLIVVLVAVGISVPAGLLAGYKGGWGDALMMRLLDAITSIPGIVAALAIVGVLGSGLNNVMIALVVILVPNLIRLVRAQSLAVAAEPYIMASRSVGSRTPWILMARVLPGVVPALSVQISLSLGAALTSEAALSFLGLGVPAPDASWGNVLDRSYRNILRDPEGLLPPMVAIGTVVLAFNLVGDGLRDSLGKGVNHGSRRRSKLGITTVERGPSAPTNATGQSTDVRLSVNDLCVEFDVEGERLQALDNVNLEVGNGEVLGLVGESGSGKTVTAMSIMRLLQSPPGIISGGSVVYDGTDLLDLDLKQTRSIRGSEIAMVFQNPMTSLDPVYTVGNSLREAIRNHAPLSKAAATQRAVELLDLVGISSPAERLGDYPHSFSGGMRQRVMIAMALAGEPRVLIADEPTTALDVTIQAQILDLLDSLRRDLGMSIILVTHDLGVVAQICDRVSVMYAGQIVETAGVHDLFESPRHPYSAGLLRSAPSIANRQERLPSLPGLVPQLDSMPTGCRFAPRCEFATQECRESTQIVQLLNDTMVRCSRAGELNLVRP